MAIDPSNVRRFAHGSRVPGWDEAADLTKDPAVVPDPATTPVPAHDPARRSRRRWPSTRTSARPRSRRCTSSSASTAGARRGDRAGRLRDAADARVPDRGGDVLRHVRRRPEGRHDVYVCTNISCSLRGADEIYDAMLERRRRRPRLPRDARSSASAPATSRRWRRSTASTSGRSRPSDCARIVEDVQGRARGAAGQAARSAAEGRDVLEGPAGRRCELLSRTSTSPGWPRSTATRSAAATRCCARR